MLLRFAGFEDNNLLEILPVGSSSVVVSPTPRTGGYCLKVPGINSDFTNGWSMLVNKNEFYFQYAVRRGSDPASSDDRAVFKWVDAYGNVLGSFYLRLANWFYDVYIGPKTTLIGSTISGISETWMVVEGYIKIHDTAGRVIIKINGVVEVDFTGNTKPGAATEVASITHGQSWYSGTNRYLLFDDIIVNDTTGASFNSWPMGIKCHKVAAPLANGNYHAWTPSAGQNFECIDESPPSMDDYVEGAAGQKDSYAFGDAPVGLTGIAGVVVRYYGQGNGDIKRLCRYGGVDYLSDAFTVPGTFNKVDDVMPEKPGGGGWNETVFNACEFGMEHQ